VGLDGALVVEPLTEDLGRFKELDEVYVSVSGGCVKTRAVKTRPYRERALVWLESVGSPEDAGSLVGGLLCVAPEAARLARASTTSSMICGARGEGTDGSTLGRVADVLRTPGGDLLVLTTPDGSEALVPLVKELVREISVSQGSLVVEAPEGLLDLNRDHPPASDSRRGDAGCVGHAASKEDRMRFDLLTIFPGCSPVPSRRGGGTCHPARAHRRADSRSARLRRPRSRPCG